MPKAPSTPVVGGPCEWIAFAVAVVVPAWIPVAAAAASPRAAFGVVGGGGYGWRVKLCSRGNTSWTARLGAGAAGAAGGRGGCEGRP